MIEFDLSFFKLSVDKTMPPNCRVQSLGTLQFDGALDAAHQMCYTIRICSNS